MKYEYVMVEDCDFKLACRFRGQGWKPVTEDRDDNITRFVRPVATHQDQLVQARLYHALSFTGRKKKAPWNWCIVDHQQLSNRRKIKQALSHLSRVQAELEKELPPLKLSAIHT